MHAEYNNVLWNGQAPAHYAGLGARQACQGEPGDTPNIMGKGKAIPWHSGPGWHIHNFKKFMFYTHILVTITCIWSSPEDFVIYHMVKKYNIICHPRPYCEGNNYNNKTQFQILSYHLQQLDAYWLNPLVKKWGFPTPCFTLSTKLQFTFRRVSELSGFAWNKIWTTPNAKAVQCIFVSNECFFKRLFVVTNLEVCATKQTKIPSSSLEMKFQASVPQASSLTSPSLVILRR